MLIKSPFEFRKTDKHGSGAYLAPRGDHLHRGVDIACCEGSIMLAVSAGKVSKIGYPYRPSDPKKGHLRYIQITDDKDLEVRYFYVAPMVEVGVLVASGAQIGRAQGLTAIYPGITDHIHFEVRRKDGSPVNPHEYLQAHQNEMP